MPNFSLPVTIALRADKLPLRPSKRVVFGIFCAGLLPWSAQAFDQGMIGAWSQSGSDCKIIFQYKGTSVSFRKPIDEFRTAFIITSKRITLPTGQCTINGSKADADGHSLSMTCSNTISFFDRHARLQLDGNALIYSGSDNRTLDVRFERCLP